MRDEKIEDIEKQNDKMKEDSAENKSISSKIDHHTNINEDVKNEEDYASDFDTEE